MQFCDSGTKAVRVCTRAYQWQSASLFCWTWTRQSFLPLAVPVYISSFATILILFDAIQVKQNDTTFSRYRLYVDDLHQKEGCFTTGRYSSTGKNNNLTEGSGVFINQTGGPSTHQLPYWAYRGFLPAWPRMNMIGRSLRHNYATPISTWRWKLLDPFFNTSRSHTKDGIQACVVFGRGLSPCSGTRRWKAHRSHRPPHSRWRGLAQDGGRVLLRRYVPPREGDTS